MIKTKQPMMDAQLHAQSKHYGLVQDNLQFVTTMVQPYVEMDELKLENNAMMVIWLTETVAATDVKKKLQ
jgi:hypothetical protein